MRIAEIYRSIQGEGLLTGTPSVLVRLSGCNLRCRFCDTPYASWHPEGDDLSIEEVVARVESWECQHVVLTGGEPMLFAELVPLCDRLRRSDRHITIETAGTLFLPLACDLMSISPKLSNSTPSVAVAGTWQQRHERSRHVPAVIRQLVGQYTYQLKFVIDTRADCDEVQTYLAEFPEVSRDRVLLMPQGVEQSELAAIATWLDPYCRQHGFRLCPRKQIEWFGLVRGT